MEIVVDRENTSGSQDTSFPSELWNVPSLTSPRTMRSISLILLAASIANSTSFNLPRPHVHSLPRSSTISILNIRGGDSDTMTSSTKLLSALAPVSEALVSGSPLRAVGALYVVASLTVVPLTLIRQAYSFSVGYGLSVATMSMALLYAFLFPDGNLSMSPFQSSVPAVLALNSLIYGLRLASFIFLREQTVESKKKAFKDLDKSEPLKRIPLALGVSLLYAFMTSPALFALRDTSFVAESALGKVQLYSTGVSVFGMILEAIADQHKYQAKRGKDGEDKFVGPTTWSYRLCRHPNYLGEILFWIGLFAAGSVSFGKSIVAWVCGTLGLWGILGIMFGASSRLDKKQDEKYSGQSAYEEWKKKVPHSLVPLFK